jgi:adenylosuccinate lyase
MGRLEELKLTLVDLAVAHRNTPIMGRTHGVHAEPITFGVKFLVWLSEAERNLKRLQSAKETVSVGCISGAVGTYAFIPPEVEEFVCREMGLTPAMVSTQVLQRDRHAEAIFTLVLTSSLCEKIALEMRHLQRTEVLEAEEGFGGGQKGSSAMPHKKNPINFEQICGLTRVLRGNLTTALENIALWHERDISHSSAERIILPDSFELCYHVLVKTTSQLKKMTFHKDRMAKNLGMTRGLHFSQKLLLALCNEGISRNEAYRMVQGIAMKVWENENLDFPSTVRENEEIKKILSKEKTNEVFDEKDFYKNIDVIYKRFGL